MSVLVAQSGKVAPVCSHCGKRGKYADPMPNGRVSLWGLGSGWWVAPYPDETVHADGTKGNVYTCPACDTAQRVGVPHT